MYLRILCTKELISNCWPSQVVNCDEGRELSDLGQLLQLLTWGGVQVNLIAEVDTCAEAVQAQKLLQVPDISPLPSLLTAQQAALPISLRFFSRSLRSLIQYSIHWPCI